MKPRVAVHKFTSCDGCQLAFLNLGEALLQAAEIVDFVHFAEAGPVDPDADLDVAFVEGSISTPRDLSTGVRSWVRFECCCPAWCRRKNRTKSAWNANGSRRSACSWRKARLAWGR